MNRIPDGFGLPMGPTNPEDDGIDRGLLNTIEMTGPIFRSNSRMRSKQSPEEFELDSDRVSREGIESDKEIWRVAKRTLML
jgi:hypothetical protein